MKKTINLLEKIRDKMEDLALRNKLDNFDIYKGFTKALYDLLSEHTHANIDNLMRFSIDFYSLENEIYLRQ